MILTHGMVSRGPASSAAADSFAQGGIKPWQHPFHFYSKMGGSWKFAPWLPKIMVIVFWSLGHW